MSTQERPDHDCQHNQGPAFGIRVVVMVFMSRSVRVPMRMPVVVMGWSWHTQPHLFRPVLSMQRCLPPHLDPRGDDLGSTWIRAAHGEKGEPPA